MWVGKFDPTKYRSSIGPSNGITILFALDNEALNFIDELSKAQLGVSETNYFYKKIESHFQIKISDQFKNKWEKLDFKKTELLFVYSNLEKINFSQLIENLKKIKMQFSFFDQDDLDQLDGSEKDKIISGFSTPKKDIQKLSLNNENLESTSKSQSSDIKKFLDEQNLKLNSERKLIKLIKDLAEMNGIEDLFLILRKELKVFSYLREPILIYTLDGESIFFSQIRNSEMFQWVSNIKINWPHQFEVLKGQELFQWVNVLNRPLSKLIFLPFNLDLSRRFFPKAKAMLLVEDLSVTDPQATPHQFLMDRQQILSMSLDRILIEYQLSLFSYRWEKVFDNLKDPVAVIDANYNVLRSNQKFNNFADGKIKKCYEAFAGRNAPCVGCPMEQSKFKPDELIEIENKNFQLIRNRIEHPEIENEIYFHRYYDETQHKQILKSLFQLEKMSSLGELSGHLAHELNNPLTGVMALAQVLKNSPNISLQIKKDLQEIENGSRRSLEIIKNLMDFTKSSYSSSGDGLEIISVDECVEKTLPFLKTALRQHRLFVDLKTKDYKVELVPQMFQQVVFNLIQNAIQALKEHGTIKVWSNLDEEQKNVCLYIEDDGMGIPMDSLNRIFEAFYTTKKEGHGTGLGLSLSKQIIEKFSGSITVESKVDLFTRFKIEFPIKAKII